MAYLIAGLVLLSLACFVAMIIGTAVGAGANDGFSQGIWPTVIMLPLLALPAAMLLTLTLLITNAVSRGRNNNTTQ